jgi:hypothetical protein
MSFLRDKNGGRGNSRVTRHGREPLADHRKGKMKRNRSLHLAPITMHSNDCKRRLCVQPCGMTLSPPGQAACSTM